MESVSTHPRRVSHLAQTQSAYSQVQGDRRSSDSLLTIYSMYGNDVEGHIVAPTMTTEIPPVPAPFVHTIKPASRASSLSKTNGDGGRQSLSPDTDSTMQAHKRYSTSSKAVDTSKTNSVASPHTSLSSRPDSSNTSNTRYSFARTTPDMQAENRQSLRMSTTSPSTSEPWLARTPSQLSKSPSNRLTTPPPPETLSHSRPQSSFSPTPRPTSSISQSTPPRPPSQLIVPSPKSPYKHADTPNSIPSQTSLVQSQGEDLDAFHVRNTYAQLEMCGVKGDGYEEGVERTRARIGSSRASQANAADALGDGTEKTKDLSPKEIETLSHLDRYGFFTVPSHDRLVVLPADPLLKRLAKVAAGPPSAPSHASAISALPPAQPLTKELSRIEKWTRMLIPLKRDQGGNVELWGIKSSKQRKLRERTYKGIPDRWRSAAWGHLVDVYAKSSGAESQKLAKQYRVGLESASEYDIQIDLDVPRTISGHVMFRTRYGAGQRSLFHVLHSFSLHCKTCGYVQGMGPIAATLLCYMDPEHVYASLIHLHDSYSLHTIFSPGFPGLLEAIYVQERITQSMMPDVYEAFKKHMISTTSYATKWYITLFTNSVPFQTQLRLWDAFFVDGPDVFIAVAVAIVWTYRDHITSNSANFETVLSLLSSFFVPQNEDALMGWVEKALGDPKLRASMSAWRTEWQGLVASGKDGSALL